MSKVALIIIYNHQYNKNIESLEKLYGGRFSEIYHLVPFYNGNKKNVIPVYENSFYFQGYISQGLKYFFNEKYEHYFFIGDDLILNPIINENNYYFHLKLDKNTSFTPYLFSLNKINYFWDKTILAYNYNINQHGVEIEEFMPTYEEAIKLLKNNNLEIKPISYNKLFRKPNLKISVKSIKRVLSYQIRLIRNKQFNLSYPLIGGYADILVINSKTIKKFCTYSGVFSATKLHVELAVPIALVFSGCKIVVEENLKLKGQALWSKEDFQILKKYNTNLKELINDFPKNHLYLHPIKLSKWK